MSKYLLLVYLFIFSITKTQAFSVYGSVESADNHLPVINATVFINNTQIFCTTDSTGNFKLDNINFYYFDIIVAAKGFQNLSYRFSKELINKKIRFQLNSSLPDSNNLIFHSYDAKNGKHKQWLKIFYSHFIGDTIINKDNYILNPEVLLFSFDSSKNALQIKTTDKLLFLNEKLGYMVNIFIDELSITENDEYSSGAIYFKPLKYRNSEAIEQCNANRNMMYNISFPHFISALYQNKLATEGFEINKVIRAFEGSDDYKKYATKSNTAIHQNAAISPLKFIYIIDKKHPISAENILEKDTTNDAVFINSTNVPILYVITKNSLLMPSSLLFFIPNKKIRIEKNGMFFEPDDIYIDGDWHSPKIENLLPYDYERN